MPKKNTRNNLRESRIGKRLEGCKIASSEVIVKQFRSIHVNVKNAKRWFMLKKRLSIVTDDDLVAYLLDLAEPIIRRDGKCFRADDWKTDQDKENDLDLIKIEERDLLGVEEPLRRSPRKQCIVPAAAAGTDPPDTQTSDFSKSTPMKMLETVVESENHEEHAEKRRTRVKHHHKAKEKHHRDKRTRKKHSRNNNNDTETKNLSIDERSALPRVGVAANDSEGTSDGTRSSSSIQKIIAERLSPNVDHALISCDANSDEVINDNERKNPVCAESFTVNRSAESSYNLEKKIGIESRIETDAEAEGTSSLRGSSEYKALIIVNNDSDVSNIARSEVENFEEDGANNRDDANEIADVAATSEKIANNEQSERKGKKRRKHSKRDASPSRQENCNVARTNETSSITKTREIIHKRRKKKHKRAASSNTHRTKKFHDGRKAPQDGMIEDSSMVELKLVNDTSTTDRVTNDESLVAATCNITKASPEIVESAMGEVPEPHRLAIKIKLCQDCNDRHIKDSCPLVSTEIHVNDRISYDEWLMKHIEIPEVAKAIASQDPISEGYAIRNDENYESDDDSGGTEQAGKTKPKNESEDKQLHVSEERPLYSRESLPDCLELRLTNLEHGIGVYASSPLPIYAKLGPLVGNPIKEMDIPDDFSMRHLWEIDNDGKTSYLSTTNPLKSNWIRYTRPADTKEDRNVTAVARNGELYLVTTRNIVKGTELTYWAESQSSVWTRKNKIDKTNCGGCNLNFSHSMYYRLHCSIFHDTRYSLTIRKYHCKVCGAAVLGKDNIMKHAADLHGGRGAYQCQYCRKFFLRLNYLEMHRTYGCSQNPQRSRPLCDFCGRKFCQPQKLKVHIKRMHSEMSEVLREFQCKMCLKLLGSRAALQRHMKEVHHKDVVGAATCDRCGKMFQNKSNLKIHMLTHSGVKPFKCKETDCKAAFTTKQCLQFHYKKVHGLSEDMMPKIERSVAYTFDAYSGGVVDGIDRQKTQQSDGRTSQQENSNSVMSLEDCSSEHSSRAEVTINAFQPAATMSELESNVVSSPRYNLDRYILNREEQASELHQDRDAHDSGVQDCEIEHRQLQEQEMQERELHERDDARDRDLQECEIHDREIQRSSPSPIPTRLHQDVQMPVNDTCIENERASGDVDFYGTRLQSKGSKKWMGQFGSLNEMEIVTQRHGDGVTTRPDVYEFNDAAIKKSEDRVENGVTTSNGLMSGAKLGLNIYRRPESTNASLLVEAALDAAERDIGAVTSPMIDDSDRDTNIYTITNQLQARHSETHLDPYIHHQDELMSPASMSQDNRKTPNSHVHMDYHLHRPVDYMNSPRSHGIEQYLPQDDLPRVASPGAYNIHLQQDELPSPSATPNQNRYQEIHHHHHHQEQEHQQQQPEHQQQHHHHHHHHHHQVPSDNLSSDEGDSVAQNLSISVKEKGLQLDLTTSYKYEQLDTEFNRERTNFEPLVLSNGELQGLDMSARGFHHPLGSQITNTRYHHHLYEITERQSVDLSRTTGYSISPPPSTIPPPPPPLYPHSEVLRIVSLDLTPGQSVDLSLSRSHHLHSTGGRIITGSPQPPGSSGSHVVPDSVEARILPSPPPSVTGYNATYPVSPAPYHPPRPGYHHYSGYY